MGIFFNDPKPHISKDEFKKVRSELYSNGWSEREIDLISSFFEASMNEGRDSDKGLDRLEIDTGIKTLKENENIYHLSDHKLNQLEQVFKKYL